MLRMLVGGRLPEVSFIFLSAPFEKRSYAVEINSGLKSSNYTLLLNQGSP
jgi:hypothetical protein